MLIEAFFIFLINFTIAKRIKYIGFSSYPTLSDILYSYILAMMYMVFYKSIIIYFFIFMIFLLNTLLFFDIALFRAYGINLDYSSLKLFIKDIKTFFQNTDDIFLKPVIQRGFYLYPLFCTLIFLVFLVPNFMQSYFIVAYFLYIIFALAKIRLKLINLLLFLILASIFLFLISLISKHLNFDFSINNNKIIITILLILIAIKYLTRNIDKIFFRVECKILDFLNISSRVFIEPKNPFKDFKNMFSLKHSDKSEVSGELEGASVILITIESLNKEVFKETIAKEKYEILENFNISSKHHFAISANTYETLQTMYNGSYKEKEIYPYIKTLKKNNYKTVFFTPQGLSFMNTIGLLNKSNFDKIISLDESKGENAWLSSDTEFYEQNYENLKKELKNNKYFVHILNSQTHTPYGVKGKIENCMIPKSRYKVSLKEALRDLDNLLLKLQKDKLLNDTLVILTGDHGESFGELKYKTHSTAITKEQLDIPFLVKHKKLKNKELDFSNHFDIFPSVLSLLGLKNDAKTLGTTLNQDSLPFVPYSLTKINKIPASFGFIDKDKKILIDLIYGRFWICDLDDKVIKTLRKEEKKQVLWALKEALEERKLLG